MKLAAHIETANAPKLVGQLSFTSFIQIAEKMASHAIDDLGLAVQNDRYKVYSMRVPAAKRTELLDLVGRYKTMAGITFWTNNVIPDNMPITLYYSMYHRKGWLLDYGISLGQDMYVIGRFILNPANFKVLPNSSILKDFKYQFSQYDLRVHTLLDTIRCTLRSIDLGYCSRTDAQIIDEEAIVSCYNLGVWEKRNGVYQWADGEADKYAKKFQEWVRKFGWWQLVKLKVMPYNNKWADFVITLK